MIEGWMGDIVTQLAGWWYTTGWGRCDGTVEVTRALLNGTMN